jgi:hypothetical protein
MTKKYQKDQCKEILNKYALNHTIIEEREFLVNVFKNHPNWLEKRGKGGRRIFIGQDNYKHRCFFIERIDNTVVDISYLTAIAGNNKSDLERIKIACRTAILPEILDYRNKNVIFGVTKCAISDEILTKENINIDHYDLKFSEMFDLWIKKYISKELVKNIQVQDQTSRFTNDIILNDFISFHNLNCKLRAVTKHVNQIVLR